MGPGAKAGIGYGLAQGLSSLGDYFTGIGERRRAGQEALAREKRADAVADRTFRSRLEVEALTNPAIRLSAPSAPTRIPYTAPGPQAETPELGEALVRPPMMTRTPPGAEMVTPRSPWQQNQLTMPSGEALPVWTDPGYEDRRNARLAEEDRLKVEAVNHSAWLSLSEDSKKRFPYTPGVPYAPILEAEMKGQVTPRAPRPSENLGNRRRIYNADGTFVDEPVGAAPSSAAATQKEGTIIRRKMPDGATHQVLVNPVTGEDIRDLGLYAPATAAGGGLDLGGVKGLGGTPAPAASRGTFLGNIGRKVGPMEPLPPDTAAVPPFAGPDADPMEEQRAAWDEAASVLRERGETSESIQSVLGPRP
jgi:hypothetical protein